MPKPDPSQAAAYANHPEAAFPPRLSDLPKQAVPAHLAAAARLERLTAELQAAKSAAKATARAAREQQARIVGAALLMALANHPDTAFRQQLVDWLRRTV